MNFGIDQPGPDRGDANALAGHLVTEPDREGIDRALGCRVIDIGVGRPEPGRNRRQVDNDAALAAMPRRHPLHGFAGTQNAAGDVDRHHALDARCRHLVYPRGAPDDAGIVDQPAKRSEPVGRLEQRQDIALFADIAFHRDGLAVVRLDGGHHLARGGLIAGVADTNPESACRGGDCGGAADAAAAAGDDHNPVVQISSPTRSNARHGRTPDEPPPLTDPAPAAPGLPDFP